MNRVELQNGDPIEASKTASPTGLSKMNLGQLNFWKLRWLQLFAASILNILNLSRDHRGL